MSGRACTATAALVTWPVYRYLAPTSGTNSAGKVIIPEKDAPEGEAKFFEFAGSAAVLVKKLGGDLIALSAVYTDLGCICSGGNRPAEFSLPLSWRFIYPGWGS